MHSRILSASIHALTVIIFYTDNDYGHLPAQLPSVAMGSNRLYEPASKAFTSEGHMRPPSFPLASGRQFINPLYDDFEDHETDGYAKVCKH